MLLSGSFAVQATLIGEPQLPNTSSQCNLEMAIALELSSVSRRMCSFEVRALYYAHLALSNTLANAVVSAFRAGSADQHVFCETGTARLHTPRSCCMCMLFNAGTPLPIACDSSQGTTSMRLTVGVIGQVSSRMAGVIQT